MKTNTLVAVIAFVGVATGGLLMWTADENQSSSFQPTASISTTHPSSAPSSTVLPSSKSSSTTSSQRPQIDVDSDVHKKASETKTNPSFEKPSSSDLAAQVTPQTQPMGPADSDLAAQVALQTQPMGPADACVEMTKTMLCPIIGQMPFVRDWAGQFAIWGKTSCPMGDPAT